MFPRRYHPRPSRTTASRWARLAAYLIDAVLLAVILPVPLLLIYDTELLVDAFYLGGIDTIDELRSAQSARWRVDLVAAATAYVYFLVQHARSGQTFGKRILGIIVVDANTFEQITVSQAILRSLSLALPIVPIVGSLIQLVDLLWIFRKDRRQTLHDKLADTVVVMTQKSSRRTSVNPYGPDL